MFIIDDKERKQFSELTLSYGLMRLINKVMFITDLIKATKW